MSGDDIRRLQEALREVDLLLGGIKGAAVVERELRARISELEAQLAATRGGGVVLTLDEARELLSLALHAGPALDTLAYWPGTPAVVGRLEAFVADGSASAEAACRSFEARLFSAIAEHGPGMAAIAILAPLEHVEAIKQMLGSKGYTYDTMRPATTDIESDDALIKVRMTKARP